MEIIGSLIQVFRLSLFTLFLGILLDNTISFKSKKKINEIENGLYEKGLKANFINLMIVSPFYYILANNIILVQDNKINIIKYIGLIIIQSLGYYYLHKMMHLKNSLKWIHEFHHKYKITVPTTGNAVTIYEFQLAYVLPFLIGGIILRPGKIEFQLSIITISLLNLFIHTYELRNIKMSKYLVSPNDHIIHHETRSNTYSAPLINIDNILKDNKKI